MKIKLKISKTNCIYYTYADTIIATLWCSGFYYNWNIQYIGYEKGEIRFEFYKNYIKKQYKYGRFTKNIPENGKELLEKVKREVQQLCG